jgi:hypothetical protein
MSFLAKDDGREDHGADWAGVDDTKSIRNRHEADTGQAGDEGDGSYETWRDQIN